MRQLREQEVLSRLGMAPDAERFREVLSDFFHSIEYHDAARVIEHDLPEEIPELMW